MNTSGDAAPSEQVVAPAVLRAVPTIGKGARAELKGQKPLILWMTGLSGAGKSTIATRVEERLWRCGHHTMLLDGDNLRFGLNSDLTFTDAARIENIRRTAEVAKLMLDAGLIVICSLISPFRRERMLARQLVGPDEFLEVFVDAPLDVCKRRDPKGSMPAHSPGRSRTSPASRRPTSRRRHPRFICGRMPTMSTPWPSRFWRRCESGAPRPAVRDDPYCMSRMRCKRWSRPRRHAMLHCSITWRRSGA